MPRRRPHVNYALSHVREAGVARALAVNPSTPPSVYAEVLDLVDVALCMTVNPGWGGQPFIARVAGQDPAAARAAAATGCRSRSTAASTPRPPARAPQAGASIFVAGNAVFGADDPAAAYAELKAATTAKR